MKEHDPARRGADRPEDGAERLEEKPVVRGVRPERDEDSDGARAPGSSTARRSRRARRRKSPRSALVARRGNATASRAATTSVRKTRIRPGSPRCSGPSRSPGSDAATRSRAPASSDDRRRPERARAARRRGGDGRPLSRDARRAAPQQHDRRRPRAPAASRPGKEVALRRRASASVSGPYNRFRSPAERKSDQRAEKTWHLAEVAPHPVEPAGFAVRQRRRERTRGRRAPSRRARPASRRRPRRGRSRSARQTERRRRRGTRRRARSARCRARSRRKQTPKRTSVRAVCPAPGTAGGRGATRHRNAPHWNCRCGSLLDPPRQERVDDARRPAEASGSPVTSRARAQAASAERNMPSRSRTL